MIEFARAVFKGLYSAFKTDVDVFLLGVSGLLLGAPLRALRGFAVPILIYTAYRRLDQVLSVVTQLRQPVINRPPSQVVGDTIFPTMESH